MTAPAAQRARASTRTSAVAACLALAVASGLAGCGPARAGSGAASAAAASASGTASAGTISPAEARASYTALKAPLDQAFAQANSAASTGTPLKLREAELRIAEATYTFGQGVYTAPWPATSQTAETAFLKALAVALAAERAAGAARTPASALTLARTAAKDQAAVEPLESRFRVALGFTS